MIKNWKWLIVDQSQWNFKIEFSWGVWVGGQKVFASPYFCRGELNKPLLIYRPFALTRYRSDYRLVDSGERVRVMTRMSSPGDSGTALSILNIDNVHLSDKGNYTCKPASGGQASISLHVLEGENKTR